MVRIILLEEYISSSVVTKKHYSIGSILTLHPLFVTLTGCMLIAELFLDKQNVRSTDYISNTIRKLADDSGVLISIR